MLKPIFLELIGKRPYGVQSCKDETRAGSDRMLSAISCSYFYSSYKYLSPRHSGMAHSVANQ